MKTVFALTVSCLFLLFQFSCNAISGPATERSDGNSTESSKNNPVKLQTGASESPELRKPSFDKSEISAQIFVSTVYAFVLDEVAFGREFGDWKGSDTL